MANEPKSGGAPFETIVDPQSVIPPDGTDQRESETGGTLLAGALIEAFEDMFGIERRRTVVGHRQRAVAQFDPDRTPLRPYGGRRFFSRLVTSVDASDSFIRTTNASGADTVQAMPRPA